MSLQILMNLKGIYVMLSFLEIPEVKSLQFFALQVLLVQSSRKTSESQRNYFEGLHFSAIEVGV